MLRLFVAPGGGGGGGGGGAGLKIISKNREFQKLFFSYIRNTYKCQIRIGSRISKITFTGCIALAK